MGKTQNGTKTGTGSATKGGAAPRAVYRELDIAFYAEVLCVSSCFSVFVIVVS